MNPDIRKTLFSLGGFCAVLFITSQLLLGQQTTQKQNGSGTRPKPVPQSTSNPKPVPSVRNSPNTSAPNQRVVAPAASAGYGVDAAAMARQAEQLQLNSDAATLMNSRNQAFAAQNEANKAAFHAGELAGADATTRGNIEKRLQGVKAALQHWQQSPPKTYSSAAPRVELADPFRVLEPANASGGESVADAIHGTCLELDRERDVARVASSCASSGCGERFKAGDYPVLGDGNVLDTNERVKEFFKECQSPLVSSVRLSND